MRRPHLFALVTSLAPPHMQSLGMAWQLPAGIGQLAIGMSLVQVSPAPLCSAGFWAACVAGGLCVAGVLDWRLRRTWAATGAAAAAVEQGASGPATRSAKAKAG
jgi:hypothetical protein